MIKSMTAFGRASAQGEWGQATWELRTVNHRYLDVTTKMPEALRSLENKVREIAQTFCNRGKLECGLRFRTGTLTGAAMTVNESLVAQLGEACKTIEGHLPGSAQVDPTRLLSWPGVLQTQEGDMSQVHEHVLALLHEAFDALVDVRQGEGQKLQALILARVSDIREQVILVKSRLPIVLEEQRDRMKKRLADIELVDVDNQRLEQEMAFLIQKMDVMEELDRLDTHLDEVERVLINDKVVGRRLDFLMQELNREVNTLSSKSQDTIVTKAAVEMKVLTEQMREQIQNLE